VLAVDLVLPLYVEYFLLSPSLSTLNTTALHHSPVISRIAFYCLDVILHSQGWAGSHHIVASTASYQRAQYQHALITQATPLPPTATPTPALLRIPHRPPPPEPPPCSSFLLLHSSSEPSQPAPDCILTATPQHCPSALMWQPTPSGVE
jgi:hypothetical protein